MSLDTIPYEMPCDVLKHVINNWFCAKYNPRMQIDYLDVTQFIVSCSKSEMPISKDDLSEKLNMLIIYKPAGLVDRLTDPSKEDQDRECFIAVTLLLVYGFLPPPRLASSILNIFSEQDGSELTRQVLQSESLAANVLKENLRRLQDTLVFICAGCSKAIHSRIYFLEFPLRQDKDCRCCLCEKDRNIGYNMTIYEHERLKSAYSIYTRDSPTSKVEEIFEESKRAYFEIQKNMQTPRAPVLNEEGYVAYLS